MVKIITIKWLKSKGACKESIEAWQNETDHNTFATLNRLLDKNPEWGNWLVCRLMNKNKSVQYAIFAAEQVIDIYEGRYPNDKRPRNAIEAAKAYLKNPSKKTKAAANTAANAAANTADAAAFSDAFAAAYAAAYAAYAAYASAYAFAAASAVNAASDAASDAAYADAYERRKMQARILEYGIGLLEQS